jgi:uncharacterized protein YllA (UPF0747 family)
MKKKKDVKEATSNNKNNNNNNNYNNNIKNNNYNYHHHHHTNNIESKVTIRARPMDGFDFFCECIRVCECMCFLFGKIKCTE